MKILHNIQDKSSVIVVLCRTFIAGIWVILAFFSTMFPMQYSQIINL